MAPSLGTREIGTSIKATGRGRGTYRVDDPTFAHPGRPRLSTHCSCSCFLLLLLLLLFSVKHETRLLEKGEEWRPIARDPERGAEIKDSMWY